MAQLDERIKIRGSGLKANMRWYIAGLLMLTTTLSYLDKQAFTIASVVINKQFHFNAEQYGFLTSLYLLAFGLSMPLTGKFVDWIGTRRGLAITMFAWSLTSMAHAFGNGMLSFGVCRCLLGITESNNFPAAAKAVSEWFPPKERAFATGIYNCGAGFGALIAPPLIASLLIPIYGWRASFLITGALGFFLVWNWLRVYHIPTEHPRISQEELKYIQTGQAEEKAEEAKKTPRGIWREVLTQRNFWGMAIARIMADPVWAFYLFWLPAYLSKARHFDLVKIGMFAWVPFLAADLGSIAGGALSSYLIKRGKSPVTARKITMCIAAALMPVAIPAARVENAYLVIFFISVATFAHQAWSANTLTLPADMFPNRIVAGTYGLTAGMSNIANMLFMLYIGWMVRWHGYTPVFFTVAFMHPIGALVAVFMIKMKKAKEKELVGAAAS